jgi:hypothetical protein
VTSVANQRNTTLPAHSITAAHQCDPFSHPFNPFNPYPKKNQSRPERQFEGWISSRNARTNKEDTDLTD